MDHAMSGFDNTQYAEFSRDFGCFFCFTSKGSLVLGLGVFSAETDWFWYCLLTSIALSTIGGIMLGVHQATVREHDDHSTNRSTTYQTMIMIVILAVSAVVYLNHTS